eukprot:gnl/TRDRNA2_/TRDRNA2_183032_c0_seq1.p1 gnl/TRDRNA2_/TRDRNA2_183032_c0~~gnl/TRDRNA2_/TRDRNA2_183032_c0_seq1.p1  ORF type:complete len:506 (+),score=134.01 gnl/TRDRNA2_/TRDRNA2_183032_c0_seq1:132-1649(+)
MRVLFVCVASVLAAVRVTDAQLLPREEACRFCYRQCPIACFVGTCGLEYGFAVQRYEMTNQCFTCEASASVGVNKQGDFNICSADESAAASIYTKQQADNSGVMPPSGPGMNGDAAAAIKVAADHATDTAKVAMEAANKANLAAMMATQRYRDLKAKVKGPAEPGSISVNDAQVADAHSLAMQIRSEEKRRAMEAAHKAWATAVEQYNDQLFMLRKQQLATDQAEAVVRHSEKVSEQARADYTKAAAAAAAAARDSAMMGAEAAGTEAAMSEAEELAATAKAAQRKLIIAAANAKEAALGAHSGANAANVPPAPKPTLAPCKVTSFLQTGVSHEQPVGCQMPVQAKPAPLLDAPDNPANDPAVMASIQASRPNMDDVALLPDGSPDMSRVSNELTENLAEKLAANPSLADNQQTFAADLPKMPGMPDMPGVGDPAQALQLAGQPGVGVQMPPGMPSPVGPGMPQLQNMPDLPPMASQSGGMYMVPPEAPMSLIETRQGHLRHGTL